MEKLQNAIELELTTIPVYMSGWNCIVPGTNLEYQKALKEVLIQEMNHMCLACNILIAIGGVP